MIHMTKRPTTSPSISLENNKSSINSTENVNSGETKEDSVANFKEAQILSIDDYGVTLELLQKTCVSSQYQ